MSSPKQASCSVYWHTKAGAGPRAPAPNSPRRHPLPSLPTRGFTSSPLPSPSFSFLHNSAISALVGPPLFVSRSPCLSVLSRPCSPCWPCLVYHFLALLCTLPDAASGCCLPSQLQSKPSPQPYLGEVMSSLYTLSSLLEW